MMEGIVNEGGWVHAISDAERGRRLGGLRINAFAALVMLLVEFSLGMWVNLDATVPVSDHGVNLASAIARAIVDGPIGLSVHALLGLMLIVSASVAGVRAVRIGQVRWMLLTGVGLASVLLAALSGARFVGTSQDGASLSMALFAALSMFCYALILFRALPAQSVQDDRLTLRPGR